MCVSDGNTVVLLDADNTQQKIRLHGIDAPENRQPYGDKSKNIPPSPICSIE
ncbi:hypothetical protein KL86DYS2_10781 [uncultured Dysgonomonas sp.]|uniref:Uncharacterized protein n=1 Tax=uncultured Dysgonomonas sp. TaxID=206096 RepID=A0A212J5I8_9BACT|nr:hypothetical protein KL86DYS2_10781 [uncultured Dysgonomonas sp.]